MGLFGKKKSKDSPFCSAVVAAAGSANRMEGQDKMLVDIGGIPVLVRSLLSLERCPLINEIVVVTREEKIPVIAELCKDYQIGKVTKVIVGGDTRTKSVYRGVQECSCKAELIAIHDGARPFVTQDELREALEQGAKTGAAAPAVPVKDTVKEAENGLVVSTPDRSRLFAIQTPQVFEASLIKAALVRAQEENWSLTDDCALVERLGMKVSLTRGSYENMKITTPIDVAFGEAILAWREEQ